MPSRSTNTSTTSKVLKHVILTSSGNWSVPDGVTSIIVEGIGGGGGGGGTNTTGWGGSGGGSGERGVRAITVTPNTLLPVTIGAGGAGGGINSPGSAGGNNNIVDG